MKSITFTDEVWSELEEIGKEEGMDARDVVKQALGVYTYLHREKKKGSKFYISRKKWFWKWEDYRFFID